MARTLLILGLLALTPPVLADDAPEVDTMMKALVDEMQRSMKLQLEDLDKPYLIQYWVNDTVTRRISASYGALIGSSENRSRRFHPQVRVGSYDLDNTNFGGGGGFGGRRGRGGGRGGGGGGTALPIDDDYMAIRQAIWRATDAVYKSAVETLQEKRAFIKERGLDERSKDLTRTPPVKSIADRVELQIDTPLWEENLRKISAHFDAIPHIQNARVDLISRADNRYLVNSEGSRLRDGTTDATLTITAEVQADDGERLSDTLSYRVADMKQLPALDQVFTDIGALASRLDRAMKAERLDEYMGPVLFDELASAQLFQELVSTGVAAQPETVGSGRRRFRGTSNLEGRLGKRILPKFMQIFDDPTRTEHDGVYLAGHYRHDDEGVEAQRVDIVTDGKMVGMALSRVPTKRSAGSNGHGRRGRGGDPRATVGCLFVESSEARSSDAMKEALIEAARDQGLDYALRVTRLRRGGGGGNIRAMMARFGRGGRGGGRGGGGPSLSDPIVVYKVHVDDGREEPVRSCEFGPIELRTLQSIVAAGETSVVLNANQRGVPVSVVAPAVLFEELELAGIEDEFDRKPILDAPHARDGEKK